MKISEANWCLNGKDDVCFNYMLANVVSEFDIQGLRLNCSVVAGGVDYRYVYDEWTYNNLVGNHWTNVSSEECRLYLKNAYCVFFTWARQSMTSFVPAGSDDGLVRKCDRYDEIYGDWY